jgi:hypothetical protein
MLQRRPAAAAAAAAAAVAAAAAAAAAVAAANGGLRCSSSTRRDLQLGDEAAAQPICAMPRGACRSAAQGPVHGGRRGAAREPSPRAARAQVPCGGGATPLSARSERGAAPLPARPALVSRLVAARLRLHPPYLHSSASRPSAVGRDAPLRASVGSSSRACRTATQLASSHASRRSSPASATARPRGASAAAARPSLSAPGTRGSVGSERTSSD